MYTIASKVVVIPSVITTHIVVIYINNDVYYINTLGL